MNTIETGRFGPHPAMSWTGTDGELVLFDRDSGRYHTLNASASAIWRALEDHASVAEIVTAISANAPIPPAILTCDVVEFLERALAAGLVVAAE